MRQGDTKLVNIGCVSPLFTSQWQGSQPSIHLIVVGQLVSCHRKVVGGLPMQSECGMWVSCVVGRLLFRNPFSRKVVSGLVVQQQGGQSSNSKVRLFVGQLCNSKVVSSLQEGGQWVSRVIVRWLVGQLCNSKVVSSLQEGGQWVSCVIVRWLVHCRKVVSGLVV